MDPSDLTDLPDWPAILAAAGPYPIEACQFVQDGLGHTVDRVLQHAHSGGMAMPDSRHISGQQLSLGLRDFAIERYGMLAPAVLRHWNVLRTEDFGRIVYAMIEAGCLSKTAEDSITDFASVFDFEEAFSPSQLSTRIGRE